MRSLRVLLVVVALAVAVTAQTGRPFTVVDASIMQLRDALAERRTTSLAIVQEYLARIAVYEDRLNAAIAVNPRALAEAAERDSERVGGTDSRSAARHSHRPEGQHSHGRHADDRRSAGLRRPGTAL